MKHVGLNVAADPLFTASYTGVNGGLVLVAADDPGLYSSQNEQDTRCVARAAMVPVLEPSDSQEAKDFVKYAFDLSEKYDTPIIVRTTTRLSHSQGPVTLDERCEPVDVTYERNPAKYLSNYVINAMIGVCIDWMDDGMKIPARELAELCANVYINGSYKTKQLYASYE